MSMAFARRNSLFLWGIVLILLRTYALSAQQVPVNVCTNAEQAWLRVDTLPPFPVRQGRVQVTLPVGKHRLVLLPAEMDSWVFVRPETLLVVEKGQAVSLFLPFPYVYRLETLPPGAAVRFRGKILGYTTFYHVRRKPLRGSVTFEKPGYRPATYSLLGTDSLYVRVQVPLTSLPPSPTPWWKRREGDYLALGMAFVGTLISIHYKFQADALYDRYLQTGEPELKSRIRRYDRYAGWSLAVGEVGLILFGMRLLFK